MDRVGRAEDLVDLQAAATPVAWVAILMEISATAALVGEALEGTAGRRAVAPSSLRLVAGGTTRKRSGLSISVRTSNTAWTTSSRQTRARC